MVALNINPEEFMAKKAAKKKVAKKATKKKVAKK